jgi:hypothetical protein
MIELNVPRKRVSKEVQLKRLASLFALTLSGCATLTYDKDSVPSPSVRRDSESFRLPVQASSEYLTRLATGVQSNIVFDPQQITQGTVAVVKITTVKGSPIPNAEIIDSKGNPQWTSAVVRAVLKSAPFVPDASGTVPSPIILTFRPSGINFISKVFQRVSPHLVCNNSRCDEGRPVTEVMVRCAPDGAILSATTLRSSGNADWNAVALNAVNQADPMPLDDDGKAVRQFRITLRPY